MSPPRSQQLLEAFHSGKWWKALRKALNGTPCYGPARCFPPRQQNPDDPLSGQVRIPVPPNPRPPPEAPAATTSTATASNTARPTETATANTTTTYTGDHLPDEYEISPEEKRWQWMLAPPEPTPAKRRKEDPEPTEAWDFPARRSKPASSSLGLLPLLHPRCHQTPDSKDQVQPRQQAELQPPWHQKQRQQHQHILDQQSPPGHHHQKPAEHQIQSHLQQLGLHQHQQPVNPKGKAKATSANPKADPKTTNLRRNGKWRLWEWP